MVDPSIESEDPCDGITTETLDGWIKHDSSGMREENNRKELGRGSGDRYQNSWIRFDND